MLIALRHWTTVIANVEDSCGIVIHNPGNLGQGWNELDRIDVAALPGDIDQNGKVNPLDLIAFKRVIYGLSPCPGWCGWAGETMLADQP